MPLKRVVTWVQAAALAAAGVFVIMLFAGGSGGGGASSPGAQIYGSSGANCARCHGADGQGGLGPALANVVAKKYPNVEDQIAVVAGGIGTSMPAFGRDLTKKQIRQVVEYTRTELGD